MISSSKPSPNRLAFGRLVRQFRKAAGLTQIQLGERINLSNSWVSDVENGQLLPAPDQTREVEEVLGLPAATLEEVRLRAVDEPHPIGSFDALTIHERRASVIYKYDPLVVTGLLQTPEYARALIGGGGPTLTTKDVDDLVAARLSRQTILKREDPPPPTLWAILDETALRKPIGGSAIHQAQLDALMQAAEMPRISVRLIAADTASRPGLTSSFSIFRFPDREDADVGYSEDQLAGHPYEDPESVKSLWNYWDAIAAVTLPAAQSLELIAEVSRRSK